MGIRVIGPRDQKKPDEIVVNTTSRASGCWSQGLSPFFLGPVPLYPGVGISESRNVENAWQYSKVYPEHVNAEGNPTPSYFEWAEAGWQKERADRYPMGKGRKPLYSWWAGAKLGYVDARKQVYIPIYAKAVVATQAFAHLLALCRTGGDIALWDFDGYDHLALGMTLKEVANCPSRKMGHAFVLAMLLGKLL